MNLGAVAMDTLFSLPSAGLYLGSGFRPPYFLSHRWHLLSKGRGLGVTPPIIPLPPGQLAATPP